MKSFKRLLAILLCIVMTVSVLVSCKKDSGSAPAKTDKESETDKISDTQKIPDETEPTQTAEPDITPEPSAAYDWVVEPAAIEGNIRPVYNLMNGKIYPYEICFLDDNGTTSIISYDGEIKRELPSEGYGNYDYCSVCDCITNHMYRVTEPGYTVVEIGGGHGGGSYTPYIYDKDTGELFKSEIGTYTPADESIKRAIVSISAKRMASEEEADWYGTDYVYENVDGYGIVVDKKLVQQGFDMYTPYSCGVVALRSNDRWGYYDENGNELFPCEYGASSIERYDDNGNIVNIPYHATEGVIALNKGGKWAFADVEGNLLTDFEFDEARPVYNGMAWVKTADGWGVIELNYDYTEDEALTAEDSKACSGFSI